MIERCKEIYSYEGIMRIIRYIISYMILIFGIPLSYFVIFKEIKNLFSFNEEVIYLFWLPYFAVVGYLVYKVNKVLNRLGDKYEGRKINFLSYIKLMLKETPPIIYLILLFVMFKVGSWAIDLIIINPHVEYTGVFVVHNAGIGDDWRFIVEINGEVVGSGVKVKPINGKFRIKATAIEQDTHSDINSETVIIDVDDIGEEIITVVVYETKGRGVGKTATVEFTFEVDD